MSIILAVIFQATHIVDTAVFPRVNPKTGNMDVDWARLQVETAQDYGHDDPLITFFSGSLNYQVVHHLFPSIAQEHLPAVAKIVKETAKEFGVKYEIVGISASLSDLLLEDEFAVYRKILCGLQ